VDKMEKERLNGFEELKYYIMSSIQEIKDKLDKLEERVNLWRQQSLAETIEMKTKISVFAGIIAFIVSLGVTIVSILFAK